MTIAANSPLIKFLQFTADAAQFATTSFEDMKKGLVQAFDGDIIGSVFKQVTGKELKRKDPFDTLHRSPDGQSNFQRQSLLPRLKRIY